MKYLLDLGPYGAFENDSVCRGVRLSIGESQLLPLLNEDEKARSSSVRSFWEGKVSLSLCGGRPVLA